MKKTTKFSLLLLAVSMLTACDNEIVKELKEERAHRLYQEAMNDYSAGRMDAAVEGFKKAIAQNPGNASARFQLACLLQDHAKDIMGAICCYRDFILLQPDSDKAKLAKARLAICERLLGDELSQKAGGTEIAEKFSKAMSDLKVLEAARTKLAADLEAQKEVNAKLASENERLRTLVSSLQGETPAEKAGKAELSSIRDLLDEAEPEKPASDIFADVKDLNDDADAEDRNAVSGASILPTQPKDAKAQKRAAEEAAKKAREASKSDRPETYVVQEGDTLYKIANKFYGRTSAWKLIREANKGIISSDGRVRAGQEIRLP